MRSGLARPSAAIAVAVAVALTLAAVGPAATATGSVATAATPPSPRAERALAELLDGRAAPDAPSMATLPRFREVMGYAPVAAQLSFEPADRAVKADGACSSPIGATWFDFSLPCKAHDLGYDLLRYADRTGTGLSPGARRLLDDRFAVDLHAHCAATRRGLAKGACHTLAWVYAGVARLNSWRQRYGTP